MKRILGKLVYFAVFVLPLVFLAVFYFSAKLPDVYFINEGESKDFSFFPFSVTADRSCVQCSGTSQNVPEFYSATLKFMNLIPLKSVKVGVCESFFVTPCGLPFGVKLYTKGAVVVGTSSVAHAQGVAAPCNEAGIKKGDVIIAAGGKEIAGNDELEEIIQLSGGEEIELKVLRENSEFTTHMRPLKSVQDGKYRVGIWVRDSSAGIGTLTFFSKQTKVFAGLGHGICDVDTAELLPLSRGEIVGAQITNVVRGSSGVPGELKGCFKSLEPIGEICVNSETGLYGSLSAPLPIENEVKVTMKQNVKKGPAQILTTLEGETPELYSVNIDSINYDVTIPTKNMKITVTDQRLLAKTGGIVQGMSGSPILQNGNLVGAVTHVLVNNPARGFAIFAETMLTNSNNFLQSRYKNAS